MDDRNVRDNAGIDAARRITKGSARGPGKGEQTRQAILEAAIARFGREGYRSTSVADIARDAAVGGTVAYAYFPSKEALFLAALDEDAHAVVDEALAGVTDESVEEWRQRLFFTLVSAVERHPLARRVVAGLEPDVIDRVHEIPVLTELRKACVERLREEQLHGTVRNDIDATAIGNGMVSIVLSLLASAVQVGGPTAITYGHDIAAVFEAAIEVPRPG